MCRKTCESDFFDVDTQTATMSMVSPDVSDQLSGLVVIWSCLGIHKEKYITDKYIEGGIANGSVAVVLLVDSFWCVNPLTLIIMQGVPPPPPHP